MSRQTFNYSPANVQGGQARSVVTLGPRPEPVFVRPKPKPPQGEYVTRKTGVIGAATFRQNLMWLKKQPKPLELETTEDWLKRHQIGGV